MFRTSTGEQFGGLVELLAAVAVETGVAAAIEVATGGGLLPQPLHAGGMTVVAAGPQEIVERQRQHRRQFGEASRVGRYEG